MAAPPFAQNPEKTSYTTIRHKYKFPFDAIFSKYYMLQFLLKQQQPNQKFMLNSKTGFSLEVEKLCFRDSKGVDQKVGNGAETGTMQNNPQSLFCHGRSIENLFYYVRKTIESGRKLAQREMVWIQHQGEKIQLDAVKDITGEFNQILLSPAVFNILLAMVATGLLEAIIPELLWGKGLEQSFIHPDDVLTHNFRTCSLIKPKLNLRLAALLHDVGKPCYYVEDPLVGRRFPEHHLRSADLVSQILNRFGYAAEFVSQIQLLVEKHMFIWHPQDGLQAINDLMQKVGRENIADLFALIASDREAIWGERIKGSNQALWRALSLVLNNESVFPTSK